MDENYALLPTPQPNETSSVATKSKRNKIVCCCCTPYFANAPSETYSFRDYIVRLRYTPIYSFYAVIMILLCAFLLFWSIFRAGISEIWFICLEGVVTTCLCIEVSITFCIQKCRNFFRAILNWIDLFCVACCCVTFLLLLISYVFTFISSYYVDYMIIEEEVLSVIQDVLVIIHSIVNTIRLVIFILQQRKNPNLQRKLKLDSESSTSYIKSSPISSSIPSQLSNSNNNINPFEVRYGSFAPEKQETNMFDEIHVLSPRK